MTTKAILDNLTLLLHPIRLERFARLDAIPIRARSNAQGSIGQLPELVCDPVREVLDRTPRLVLAAVSDLMSQQSDVIVAAVGKKDVIAQGHRAIPAAP
jgi:hypothetical protein